MPTVPLASSAACASPALASGNRLSTTGSSRPAATSASALVSSSASNPERPVRFAVVDCDVRAQPLDQRDLRRPAGQTDHVGPAAARGLHEQAAETTGGRRDQHHVTAAHLGKVEHSQRGPTGTRSSPDAGSGSGTRS
ncbi:MAG: hypothetical protein QOG96_5338 [Pseudonocardiales bacterium]|nr:hypothetical protein [Pseudonocardiales bacterium]